jgi:hypothetical protein
MNRPHYVMDWTALDEEIDHCSRFYDSNALAPIDRDPDAYWDGDERPTGFDFIEYHRAESDLLGTWEPPNHDMRAESINAFEQLMGIDGR